MPFNQYPDAFSVLGLSTLIPCTAFVIAIIVHHLCILRFQAPQKQAVCRQKNHRYFLLSFNRLFFVRLFILSDSRQQADIFTVCGLWEEVYRLDAANLIATLHQHLQIPLLGLWVAGDIDDLFRLKAAH